MRRIVGTILYFFLAWCVLKSWVDREAASHPGFESLLDTLMRARPIATEIRLEAPLLSFHVDNEILTGHVVFDKKIVQFSGAGSFTPSHLDIQLNASGEVGTLLKRLHPSSLFVSGDYSFRAQLKGHWSKPEVFCVLAVKNGRIDTLSSGAHLEDVTALIESDGQKIFLRQLTGDDKRGGAIRGAGTAELTAQFPYHVGFEVSKLTLLDLNHLTGLCSGNLLLKGDLQQSSIEGSLNIDSATFALDENKPSPKTIDITYINHLENPPQLPKPQQSWPLGLDIGIASSQHIWIKDKNLDSEWKADLKLQGTTLSPMVYGQMEMVKGHYLINGKNIEIKEGSIHFDGDPVKHASLSVIGVLDTNTIIAEALVSGPLRNPSLTLRSNPPLPQSDILSHLIFGRGLADITPQQSTQLKKSLKDLNTMSTGSNILDGIRSRFGIDRIELSRGSGIELEDVSLQVGKYLTKSLFIAFNKGITSPTNRIILEAELLPSLKLQGEISDTAEGQLNLKWRHDY